MRNATHACLILLAALVFFGCPAANTENDAATQKAAERLVAILAGQFNADRGEYPRSIDELVPHYLTALPKNPFTGESMQQVPEKFFKGMSEGNIYYEPVLDSEARAYDFELTVFGSRGVLRRYTEQTAISLGLVKKAADQAGDSTGPDALSDLPLVEPVVLDFGEFYYGDQQELAVSITNRREGFLTIMGIDTGCDCIEVRLVDPSVGPGESVSLAVAMQPIKMKPGAFDYQVLISFDGGIDPVALEVKGEYLADPEEPAE